MLLLLFFVAASFTIGFVFLVDVAAGFNVEFVAVVTVMSARSYWFCFYFR